MLRTLVIILFIFAAIAAMGAGGGFYVFYKYGRGDCRNMLNWRIMNHR